jgi:ketosteroid isomerase-like protein
MPETIETLLRRNLHEVFGERDAARRRRAIDALIAEDCVFFAPDGRHVEREALDAAVAALQARFPDFVFTEIMVQALEETGRLHWGFGPPGAPPRVTGLDVVLVRDGAIAALYTFLDPPLSNKDAR